MDTPNNPNTPQTPPPADVGMGNPMAKPAEAMNTAPSASMPASDQSAMSPTPPPAPKKSMTGVMILALVVLIFVFLALIYWFVLKPPSPATPPVNQVPVNNVVSPTQPVASPTPELNKDNVNGIDIGSPDAELSPVKSDVNQL